jgi:hypothetical protein
VAVEDEQFYSWPSGASEKSSINWASDYWLTEAQARGADLESHYRFRCDPAGSD